MKALLFALRSFGRELRSGQVIVQVVYFQRNDDRWNVEFQELVKRIIAGRADDEIEGTKVSGIGKFGESSERRRVVERTFGGDPVHGNDLHPAQFHQPADHPVEGRDGIRQVARPQLQQDGRALLVERNALERKGQLSPELAEELEREGYERFER